ncbi:hypothetical protein [Zavarzinella formosa]|uniref:hypothetical protein n=1 Tax=Zavarzinella formosa TaxID=360055 RepID=UPI000308ADA8|nr:hypothetical protein [Zavarzinella formosa]
MQASITVDASFGGKTVRQSKTINADGGIVIDPTLAAAKTGSLTTRTDADTGVATMEAGHGIASTNRVDLYWNGGKRIGMTATVAANAVTLDGGTGDNLPVVGTAVSAMVPQLETLEVADPSRIKGIAATCSARATVVLRDDAPAVVLQADVTDTADYIWDGTGSNTAESADNLADVYLSHGDSTGSRQVSLVVMLN